MKIKNSAGLSACILENGSVESIEAGKIRVSLRKVNSYTRSGTNLYLRIRNIPFSFIALTGPESSSQFKLENNQFFSRGSWEGLEYQCCLKLSEEKTEWEWVVTIRNLGHEAKELDLIFVQDAGLRDCQNGPVNEYYVSQYLERQVLDDVNYGKVICCRQNMRQSVGNPWLMMACSNGADSASTDGMQFFGKTFRETSIPEGLLNENLGGEYAGESSVLALQEKPFVLKPGQEHKSSFLSVFVEDHPEATSSSDLLRLGDAFSGIEDSSIVPNKMGWRNPSRNYLNTPVLLPSEELTSKELDQFFGTERRHHEWENGQLLSFFKGDHDHVVLRAKETLTDRPHGHIIQANTSLVPNESIISTNPFACGVFNSHLTQGNTNFNVLLSVFSNAFNLPSEAGQRILVEVNGNFCLLGLPSAFEMGLNHCRWIYKFGNQMFQIRSWASPDKPKVNLDFRVIKGNKVSILVSHHLDESIGWQMRPGGRAGEFSAEPGPDSLMGKNFPEGKFLLQINGKDNKAVSGQDELLRPDGKRTRTDFFVLKLENVIDFSMSFLGEVCSRTEETAFEDSDGQFAVDCQKAALNWKDLSNGLFLESDHQDVLAIREILPWYGMNALTHFLTPYGLEQFGGAAWGTRDVSQGPIDLLLNLNKSEAARKVLSLIFSNQNADGGWPQWWMFDRYQNIRANEAHGDIIYWPILALAKYIRVTEDFEVLHEVLPYYQENGVAQSEKTPLAEHLDRLIEMIISSFISGTSLVPFGGGDWNDSLQPVSEGLASRMISSWTVEMNYQAFWEWAEILERSGQSLKAKNLFKTCENIRSDFCKHLVRDSVVAGYGIMESDGTISLLLHPSDKKTGIHYSLLPMNRGIISGIFSREQAEHHQHIIEKYLKGPDGARLMDRPLKYRGGIQTIFQRAESSTFFGREIGLMYVHEHIRYAESLARTGKAEDFVRALRQAFPADYREVVFQGDIRQANCYFSSSDVAFKSRYEADERYQELIEGKWTLRGGWRVYSSGPGIFIGLVISSLLGIRLEHGNLILDPVMPPSLNGLSASLKILGYDFRIQYKIIKDGFGPSNIRLNGIEIPFKCEENPYRRGGAVISSEQLLAMIQPFGNILEIEI